jgi:hypothetical protein
MNCKLKERAVISNVFEINELLLLNCCVIWRLIMIEKIFPAYEFDNIQTQNIIENVACRRKKLYDMDISLSSLESKYLDINNMTVEIETGRYWTEVDEAHFELFINKKNNKKLYIVFNGARTANGMKVGIPQFNRWTWSSVMDGTMLNFEDPMFYKFPDIRLGWFYGDKLLNFRESTYKVINEIKLNLNIHNENIVFYSSSGGGTVAIHMASMFKGSTVIAINPQLDLKQWEYSGVFEKIVGVDLLEDDKWGRNNIQKQINESKDSNFIIAINIASAVDMEQLNSLSNKMDFNLNFGLNKMGNLMVWLYDAKSETPHTAFEDKTLYFALNFLHDIAISEHNIEEYKPLYLLLGELWNNKWEYEMKIKHLLKTEEKAKVIMCNSLNLIFPEDIDSNVHEIKFNQQSTSYQHSKIGKALQGQFVYQLEIKEVSNVENMKFTIAIYDFNRKEYLLQHEESKTQNISIKFMTENIMSDTFIIIYNGIAGKTMHNNLIFRGACIKKMAINVAL